MSVLMEAGVEASAVVGLSRVWAMSARVVAARRRLRGAGAYQREQWDGCKRRKRKP
jgi:hypothetical protein